MDKSNLTNTIIVGRTASGKTSFAINHLLKDKRITKLLIMAYGIKYKSQYNQLSCAQYDLVKERQCITAIEKLVAFHKKIAKIVAEKSNKKLKKLPITMLCLDDFIGSDVSLRSGELCRLIELVFTQGRHIGIYCCLITQSFKQIKPVIRNNCGYIILLGRLNIATFADIAEYQSEHTSAISLLSVYNEHIKKNKYGAMLLNTTNEGDELTFIQ